jgi:hypothetical protein
MTHTPTPWEAQDFCDGEEGFAIIGTNLGGLVAYASMQPADIDNQDTSRAEANAEFIVTAVNAFEANQARIAELEKALRPFADFADALNEELPDNISIGIFADGAMRFGPSGGPDLASLRAARAALSPQP